MYLQEFIGAFTLDLQITSESESQVRITCNSSPRPCFTGVECRDGQEGPRCGRCPAGYVGDGITCKPGVTCDQQPCFPGVRCYDTVEGFQCGPCPAGYSGNGQRCRPKSGCDTTPCSPGVQCQNTHEPPFYRCGICPGGFTGNGTNCHDLDECDLAEPCDPRVHCTNLSPGYRCGPCPVGFSGSSGLEGVGLEAAVRNRQRCFDIDECADGRNGGCAQNSICHNTEGSYNCGGCKSGYVGNQTVGCHSSPGLCADGTRCDQNAECIRTTFDRYTCRCKVGWAGDGRICATDRDLDNWPDYDLRCSSTRCRKVSNKYIQFFAQFILPAKQLSRPKVSSSELREPVTNIKYNRRAPAIPNFKRRVSLLSGTNPTINMSELSSTQPPEQEQ